MPITDPYLSLRNAIIAQAAEDWKTAFIDPEGKIGEQSCKRVRAETEAFFKGEWCHNLLQMDEVTLTGAEILDRMQKYTLEELKQGQEAAKLKVTLIQQTPEPVETIAKIASICYDSTVTNKKGMVKKLYLNGHHSPFEHIYFTFKIEGISRACSHQMVRHRLAAITQRSQRYCEENGFEYVMPHEVIMEDDAETVFEKEIKAINNAYTDLVHLHDIKKEDARYLLPNACATEMYFSCNLRELIHIANERLCYRAQWEIRDVVAKMCELVDPELQWMLVPKCQSGFAICNSPCSFKKNLTVGSDSK